MVIEYKKHLELEIGSNSNKLKNIGKNVVIFDTHKNFLKKQNYLTVIIRGEMSIIDFCLKLIF